MSCASKALLNHYLGTVDALTVKALLNHYFCYCGFKALLFLAIPGTIKALLRRYYFCSGVKALSFLAIPGTFMAPFKKKTHFESFDSSSYFPLRQVAHDVHLSLDTLVHLSSSVTSVLSVLRLPLT